MTLYATGPGPLLSQPRTALQHLLVSTALFSSFQAQLTFLARFSSLASQSAAVSGSFHPSLCVLCVLCVSVVKTSLATGYGRRRLPPQRHRTHRGLTETKSQLPTVNSEEPEKRECADGIESAAINLQAAAAHARWDAAQVASRSDLVLVLPDVSEPRFRVIRYCDLSRHSRISL